MHACKDSSTTRRDALLIFSHSPGGSGGARVHRSPLPNGPAVVLVQGVVIETEGGHAAATRPKHEKIPPAALRESLRPLPEPADHAVARVEVLIHVPGAGPGGAGVAAAARGGGEV